MSIHNRNEVLNAAFETMKRHPDQLSEEYIAASFALHHSLSGGQREQLKQLVERGPVWDGDVVSKSARDDLIGLGLATRVCVKGEQGFTAANYRGWDVLRAALDAR